MPAGKELVREGDYSYDVLAIEEGEAEVDGRRPPPRRARSRRRAGRDGRAGARPAHRDGRGHDPDAAGHADDLGRRAGSRSPRRARSSTCARSSPSAATGSDRGRPADPARARARAPGRPGAPRSSSRSATTGPTRSRARSGSSTPTAASGACPRVGRRAVPVRAVRDKPFCDRSHRADGLRLVRAGAAARRRMTGRRRGDSRAVHAGLPPAAPGRAVPARADVRSALPLRGDADPAGYGRIANPTWERLEAALAELEGGEVVVFASGMAAVAAVLLRPSAPATCSSPRGDAYPGVRDVATRHLRRARRRGPARGQRRRGLPGGAAGRARGVGRDAVEPRAGGPRPRGPGRGRARRRRPGGRRRDAGHAAAGRRGWSAARTSSWPAARST